MKAVISYGRTDLVWTTEEGHRIVRDEEGDHYVVTATLDNGQRFSYQQWFAINEPNFQSWLDATRALADKGEIDFEDGNWAELEPVYGSEAYEAQGIEYFWMVREYQESGGGRW